MWLSGKYITVSLCFCYYYFFFTGKTSRNALIFTEHCCSKTKEALVSVRVESSLRLSAGIHHPLFATVFGQHGGAAGSSAGSARASQQEGHRFSCQDDQNLSVMHLHVLLFMNGFFFSTDKKIDDECIDEETLKPPLDPGPPVVNCWFSSIDI